MRSFRNGAGEKIFIFSGERKGLYILLGRFVLSVWLQQSGCSLAERARWVARTIPLLKLEGPLRKQYGLLISTYIGQAAFLVTDEGTYMYLDLEYTQVTTHRRLPIQPSPLTWVH